MSIIVSIALFCIILLTFLANPAPVSIEYLDYLFIALTWMLAIVCLASSTRYKIHQTEAQLLFAIITYLIYLLVSALLGLLNGVPPLMMLRSVGPYLNFFPLLCLGFLPIKMAPPKRIALIFISVGLLQAGYLFYLYFSHAETINNTESVLRHRITLMDPRTTLPLLLALVILPLIFSLKKSSTDFRKTKLTVCAASVIVIGLFAGIITLTRAIVLSMIVGWLVFVAAYIYYLSRSQPASLSKFYRMMSVWAAVLFVVLMISFLIPSIRFIEMGLLTRFFNHTAKDYSDGRIYAEWLPALTTWLHAGWVSIGFGIGAGNAFIIPTGEERTYIHNLSIYSLVYGGIFGFLSCLWLYYTLFKTLIIRALQSQDKAYIVFSALLASMFFYSQLFAVHKGFEFNAMLFLIIGLAITTHDSYKQNKV